METERHTPVPQEWALTDVALVIKSRSLDSAMLTQRLGLTPTLVVEPGSDPRDPSGEWRIQCDERTTRDFSEQLDFVLSGAVPVKEEILSLASEGYEVYLRVYGFTHHEAIIAFSQCEWNRISQLGIPLELAPNTNAR